MYISTPHKITMYEPTLMNDKYDLIKILLISRKVTFMFKNKLFL